MPTTQSAVRVEWLSKQDAARRLNVSPRRVLELVQKGVLPIKRERDPVTRQMSVRIHAAGLERYIDERNAPPREESSQHTSQAVATRKLEPLALLAAALQDRQPAERPLCLTLDEAAEYSGLPASYLLARIRDGSLTAADVGVRKGGRYRIARAHLDTIWGG